MSKSIRMLKTAAGPRYTFRAGQTLVVGADVSREDAAALVAAGSALSSDRRPATPPAPAAAETGGAELVEIAGVGKVAARKLAEAGFASPEAVAEAELEELADALGSIDKAASVQAAARELVESGEE